MTTHSLDWTHAYKHRLQGITPQTSSFAHKATTCAKRLANELGQNALPFLGLGYTQELEQQLDALAPTIDKYTHLLILGIGGSALGTRALQKALYPQQDRPNHNGKCIWIADNVDADTLDTWMNQLPPQQTLVLVISKSGGTIETMAQYYLVRQWLQANTPKTWQQQIIAITDAQHGELRAEVTSQNLTSFPVPNHLGGRFSVLSAVGLVPALFMGIDYKALLRGARSVAAPLTSNPQNIAQHPSWQLAVWNAELMANGYSQLIFFCYIPLWQYCGSWFAQLWAESLGKEGKGSMPIPALGVTDQHSVNQMFLDGPRDKGCLFITTPSLPKGQTFGNCVPHQWEYLKTQKFGDLLDAEALGTRMALTQYKVPLVHIDMATSDAEAIGRFMTLAMAATLFTGWLLDINPLDQPAVELGKRLANSRLGAPGFQQEHQDLQAFLHTLGDPKNVQKF